MLVHCRMVSIRLEVAFRVGELMRRERVVRGGTLSKRVGGMRRVSKRFGPRLVD